MRTLGAMLVALVLSGCGTDPVLLQGDPPDEGVREGTSLHGCECFGMSQKQTSGPDWQEDACASGRSYAVVCPEDGTCVGGILLARVCR